MKEKKIMNKGLQGDIWLNIEDQKPSRGQRIFVRDSEEEKKHSDPTTRCVQVTYYEPSASIFWYLWAPTDESAFPRAAELADIQERIQNKMHNMSDKDIEKLNYKMLSPRDKLKRMMFGKK